MRRTFADPLDLERLGKAVKRRSDRPASCLWRYREFLPLEKEENLISLGEGFTPNFYTAKLGSELGFKHLYIKDESFNPTGTFKARGAAVGVSKAKELGIQSIAMPTAGNAGGAWSAYSAKAESNLLSPCPLMPRIWPRKNALYTEPDLFGKGLISDAGK